MSDAPRDHRRQDILAYKQGFLTDDERAELEKHLQSCTSCQATLEKVTRFLPALQRALVEKPISDEDLLAAVKAQLRERQARQPQGLFPRMRLALLASAIAAAGIIFIVVQPLLRQPGVGQFATGPRPPPEQLVGAPRPPPGYRQDAGPDAGIDGGMSDSDEPR